MGRGSRSLHARSVVPRQRGRPRRAREAAARRSARPGAGSRGPAGSARRGPPPRAGSSPRSRTRARSGRDRRPARSRSRGRAASWAGLRGLLHLVEERLPPSACWNTSPRLRRAGERAPRVAEDSLSNSIREWPRSSCGDAPAAAAWILAPRVPSGTVLAEKENGGLGRGDAPDRLARLHRGDSPRRLVPSAASTGAGGSASSSLPTLGAFATAAGSARRTGLLAKSAPSRTGAPPPRSCRGP